MKRQWWKFWEAPPGVCRKCKHDEQAHGARDGRDVCARCPIGRGCNS